MHEAMAAARAASAEQHIDRQQRSITSLTVTIALLSCALIVSVVTYQNLQKEARLIAGKYLELRVHRDAKEACGIDFKGGVAVMDKVQEPCYRKVLDAAEKEVAAFSR